MKYFRWTLIAGAAVSAVVLVFFWRPIFFVLATIFFIAVVVITNAWHGAEGSVAFRRNELSRAQRLNLKWGHTEFQKGPMTWKGAITGN